MAKKFLHREYKYKRKFINACILRIRFGRRSEKTVRGYKTYIFKAMKGIVEKNIYNYMSLLNGSPCREVPKYDEILAECYIIFDNCLAKFKITKTHNFYFYFNKALSRNFYRKYDKEVNFPNTELTEEITVVHPKLSYSPHLDTEEVLFRNLGLTKFEMRVCRSRLKGERSTEFIKRYKKVNKKRYNDALAHIRLLIRNAQLGDKF